MLTESIVDAVTAGYFHTWAIGLIDEGIELLTRRPAGVPSDGAYPEESVTASLATVVALRQNGCAATHSPMIRQHRCTGQRARSAEHGKRDLDAPPHCGRRYQHRPSRWLVLSDRSRRRVPVATRRLVTIDPFPMWLV
jgi:hypothetical protein